MKLLCVCALLRIFGEELQKRGRKEPESEFLMLERNFEGPTFSRVR